MYIVRVSNNEPRNRSDAMSTKCLFSRCNNAPEFVVRQSWDNKVVCACASHVPGNKRGTVPNPTAPEQRGAYSVYPMAALSADQLAAVGAR